jgi:hypothetical protein
MGLKAWAKARAAARGPENGVTAQAAPLPGYCGGHDVTDMARDMNLPLAAGPRVGHIGPAGDVAEWLKAAVC